MIQGVVFDLDGLMFDTEDLFHRVLVEMLAARGKPYTEEIGRAMIGRRAEEAALDFKRLSGLDEPIEELMAEARSRFYAEMDTAVHPTPGLFSLLDHLEACKIPRGVATSSRRSYAELLLKRHGLFDHFGFLLSAEDVSRGKPDPQIYQKAVECFGLPASSVLALEDSAAGVASAKGAGTFCVGVPHDHSPAEGLRGADLIVPRLDDSRLLAILEPRHDHD